MNISTGYPQTLFVILIFFILALMNSLYLADIFELYPRKYHALLVSAAAVLSKAAMFLFTPLTALFIDHHQTAFLITTAILMAGVYDLSPSLQRDPT